MSSGDRLNGKVAIVTGGAGGIGRGIVRAFVDEGAKVLIVDIDRAKGEALEKETDGNSKFLPIDITQQSNAEVIVSAAVGAFGRLDILVNNAHASRQLSFLETTQEHLDLSFGTGFYATFWLMQAAYSQLKENQGSVINFGSGAGMSGMPTQTSYAAAKESIRAISRVAANEWGGDNINVNVVSPLALTEGVEAWFEEFPDMREPTISKIPLKRMGDPEKDIGRIVVFLASEDASFITGQTIMADGGSIKLY